MEQGDKNAPSTDEGHVYKDQLINNLQRRVTNQEVMFTHKEGITRTNCVSNDGIKC